MNVFEDFIVELKEENLLEDTVIDHSVSVSDQIASSVLPQGGVSLPGQFEKADHYENGRSAFSIPAERYDPTPKAETIKQTLSDQVSALQLFEHVVTASAARQNNPGSSFDDLSVKKALHRFTQACSDPESNEYFESQSAIISALEAWQADLASRDREITPAAVRRYAETANPPLSPQALFAVVRFYRSIPATEFSCAKFDAIVTRLFSKIVDAERRELLCPRGEIVKHLNQRYSEWGLPVSTPIKTDASDIEMAALSFDDFISEAEGASNIKELLSSKLFDRLRQFKHNSGPLLFVPEVAAASIECNLRISRRIIDLIADESGNGHMIENRFPGLDGRMISDAVARTIDLGGTPLEHVLQNAPSESRPEHAAPARTYKRERPYPSKDHGLSQASTSSQATILGVNRWLLIATIATLVVSAGIYLFSQYL